MICVFFGLIFYILIILFLLLLFRFVNGKNYLYSFLKVKDKMCLINLLKVKFVKKSIRLEIKIQLSQIKNRFQSVKKTNRFQR